MRIDVSPALLCPLGVLPWVACWPDTSEGQAPGKSQQVGRASPISGADLQPDTPRGCRACGVAWPGPGGDPLFQPRHHPASSRNPASPSHSAGQAWLWTRRSRAPGPLCGRLSPRRATRGLANCAGNHSLPCRTPSSITIEGMGSENCLFDRPFVTSANETSEPHTQRKTD